MLDTPGGLRGLDLARVVMSADAIVMPVCDSAFDRESAAACFAELMTLPRVASGRCKVAVVGMRLDARTHAGGRLEAWAAQHMLQYIGALRETQGYVRSVEQGLTLFDAPPAKVQADLTQWQPIIDWVDAAWQASERAELVAKAAAKPSDATIKPSNEPPAPAPAASPPPRRTPPAVRDSSVLREPAQRSVRPGLAARFGWLFTVFRSSN